MSKLIKKQKFFISHASEDRELVRRLEVELKNCGVDIWVDLNDIRSGDQISPHISSALDDCDTVLLIWSEAASKSEWVKKEWGAANSTHKKIIPCLLDETKLPTILADNAYIDISDFDAGIIELRRELKLSTGLANTTNGVKSRIQKLDDWTDESTILHKNKTPSQFIISAPKKILIIDDDRTFNLMIKTKLTKAGFIVFQAYDGYRGIELALQEKPDLILLDIRLPIIDGFEVLHEFKTREIRTRVIAISGIAPPLETAIKCVKLGACDYIVKTGKPIEVIEKINRALGLESSINLNLIAGKKPALVEEIIGKVESLQEKYKKRDEEFKELFLSKNEAFIKKYENVQKIYEDRYKRELEKLQNEIEELRFKYDELEKKYKESISRK